MNVREARAEWHQHKLTIVSMAAVTLLNLGGAVATWVTLQNAVGEQGRWIQEQKAERLAERMRLIEQAVVVQHERDDSQDAARKETLTTLRSDLSDLKTLVMRILERKP